MAESAREYIPERPTLPRLREAAAGCRGCHLWQGATQTVFGEGLKRARIMLVGEMPGDREDREGRPFVGPAGRELDRALEAAGITAATSTSPMSSSTSSSRSAASGGSTRRLERARSTPASPGSTPRSS